MKIPFTSHVHLAGAHPSFVLSTETTTDNLAEVTCEACRDHVRTIGALYSGARRNGSVRWLATSAQATDAPAREGGFRVLEELGDDGRFRRFDLRRWLSRVPAGEYEATLRVRKGEAR